MNKGFYYILEKEDIVNYMKLSAMEKLKWLEEIVLFTEKALTPEEKKIREYFRNNRVIVKNGKEQKF
ncbi:MAG: hypothetical protein A2Z57_08245 [Planctomycetes bacterium RIFCSPHIGHO2_12_39_6]|nr:MAG: hypothetical protein A2Z57_08245 [Planctomycetes bacterium RIFCSPHIGHO2_12_39_6]OHB98400.1 MAG: hypothetical protein A2W74_04340 [Planctomycetes bacterium RIFCSPLOWO2_12_38_17]